GWRDWSDACDHLALPVLLAPPWAAEGPRTVVDVRDPGPADQGVAAGRSAEPGDGRHQQSLRQGDETVCAADGGPTCGTVPRGRRRQGLRPHHFLAAQSR